MTNFPTPIMKKLKLRNQKAIPFPSWLKRWHIISFLGLLSQNDMTNNIISSRTMHALAIYGRKLCKMWGKALASKDTTLQCLHKLWADHAQCCVVHLAQSGQGNDPTPFNYLKHFSWLLAIQFFILSWGNLYFQLWEKML